MWVVRSPGGKHAEEFVKLGLVGIGWSRAAEDIRTAQTPKEFYAALRKHFPHNPEHKIINTGSQLHKFFRVMKEGDLVATYDSTQRKYHVGTIAGPVFESAEAPAGLSNVRKVRWESKIDRDTLSGAAKNSLGSTLSIFQPSSETETEIRSAVRSCDAGSVQSAFATLGVEIEDPSANAIENSCELIKDRLGSLSWDDMQSLVAGVLRALGYKTKISDEGGDRGKDIVASRDGLGLEPPRIFVEVKHRREQVRAPDIRRFIGGRNAQNDRCIFVSTGGFSTEAKYEAERSNVPLTLVDSDDLVELLIENYETTDSETRTLLPLRKTYWPA
jgi:restriction system protein